jgi:hypothetical protein
MPVRWRRERFEGASFGEARAPFTRYFGVIFTMVPWLGIAKLRVP